MSRAAAATLNAAKRGRPKIDAHGRVLANRGCKAPAIGLAHDDERDDPRAFDVELLRRRRSLRRRAIVEIEAIGGDVRPIPCDEKNDHNLAARRSRGIDRRTVAHLSNPRTDESDH